MPKDLPENLSTVRDCREYLWLVKGLNYLRCSLAICCRWTIVLVSPDSLSVLQVVIASTVIIVL